MRFFNLVIFFTLAITGFSQNLVDSLKSELKSFEKINENYVDCLNELTFQLILTDPIEGIERANYALFLADSIKYKKGIFRATTNKGSALKNSGLLDQSLEYYFAALSLEGDEIDANVVALNNNIAEVFKEKKQYDSSRTYYLRAIHLAKKHLPHIVLSMVFNNLGELYLLEDKPDSAQKYFQLGLAGGLKASNLRGIAYAHFGIAELHLQAGNIDAAAVSHHRALKIREAIEDQRAIIQSNLKLAQISFKRAFIDSAFYYLIRPEAMAIANDWPAMQSEVLRLKSDFFYKMAQFDSAWIYLDQFQLLRDSISNQNFITNAVMARNALLAELHAAENRKLKAQQRTSQIQSVLMICLGLIFILVLFAFYQFRLRKITRKSIDKDRRMMNALQTIFNLKMKDGFEELINDILKISTKTLQADKGIFWKLNKQENTIVADFTFSCGLNEPDVFGEKAYVDKFKKYFDGFSREKILSVHNVYKDARCSEFNADYLKKFNVKSLINSEVSVEGELIGILSFEQNTHYRNWTNSDKRFAATITSLLSIAFVLEQNSMLIKTLLEKNQKITDSAYMVSHYLREPLAQILGFSSIADKELKDQDEVWVHIEKAAGDIDDVIRGIAKQLKSDEFFIGNIAQSADPVSQKTEV